MSNIGIVTKHLCELIAKQVEDNGLVVWYDPEGIYEEAAKELELSTTTVLLYDGSFFKLRREIDDRKLMDGETPPRLVVYVPMAQADTKHALIELEAAGVVMQPGQQPPARNTRLAVVARNALRPILGEQTATDVEKQVEAGKLSLADLNTLAEKGGEISKGVLALIFGTGNLQEVALTFLHNDGHDPEIEKKSAKAELTELLKREFDIEVSSDKSLEDIRLNLSRHILLTELIANLGDAIPDKLKTAKIASSPGAIEACIALVRTWRLRRDFRDSYVVAALRVEKEYSIDRLKFDAEKISEIETFLAIERTLLSYVEKSLLKVPDGNLLTLAQSRMSRFWADTKPAVQARWALIVSAAEVLLEAERVGKALQSAPESIDALVKEYAQGNTPWCLLDTYHRHMESRWHNFEPELGNDHENIEKLIIKARQRYTEVGSELTKFFATCIQKGKLPSTGLLRQSSIFEKYVRPGLEKEKTAYVWVDALRFEMVRELTRLLKEEFDIELQPAIAAVPTITEIGMAALLPQSPDEAKIIVADSSKLALEIAGAVIKNRKDRITFLKEHADVPVFDTKLEELLPKPKKRVREGIQSAQLVLVTSQEIDELCEQDNIAQARRQIDGVLNDLRRGLRILNDLGVQRVLLTSDHGHLFAEELSEDMKIDSPGGKTADLHRRCWIGQGGSSDASYLRIPLKSLGMESDLDFATPKSFACFKVQGGARAYFHGGLSPQELIIPLALMRPAEMAVPGPTSGIQWELQPGARKLTTRFFSVQVSGNITGLFELQPPRVSIEVRAKGKCVTVPVSASYGFEEATGDVQLKLRDDDPRSIEPNTVTVMLTEEVDQKTVSIYLIDAVNGAELARLEKIEVAISI